MKTIRLGIFGAITASMMLTNAIHSFAVEGLTIQAQSTNAVLSWPSSSNKVYLVESETNLLTQSPWIRLTNYLRAATSTNFTLFTNAMLMPTNFATGGGTNSGGGTIPLPGGTNTSSGTNTGPYVWPGNGGFYQVFDVSPVTMPTFFTVNQDSYQNQLSILQNAHDPNDDYFLLSNVIQPTNGSITYSADASTFQYTPTNGFFGVDSFSYSITNRHGSSASAVVTVFVNQSGNNSPTANDVMLTLQTNVYAVTFNALTNASDPDGDTNTLYTVTLPRYGSVSNDLFGNITYVRNPLFFGSDTFTSIITDGKGGYVAGNVMVQQVDTSGAGMPDQWLVKYGMDATVDNSLNDPDSDGLPNLAEYQLGTNPNQSDNPLDFVSLTNGAALSGFVKLPLYTIKPWVSAPAIRLFVNGNAADHSFLSQGPDGRWIMNWDTAYITNGNYSIQAGFQYNPDASSNIVYGIAKTILVTNQMTFDPLTSQFTSFLLLDATLALTNANYTVQLYGEDGNPLVYGSGTVTNGQLHLYWDLTDGHGNQLSFGSIKASFTLSPTTPSPLAADTPIIKWFLKEPGSSGGTGFVAAWGWDYYGYSFNNYHNMMMANSVVDILGNPADYNPYVMAPSQNVPLAGLSFRYNDESDKKVLMAAIQQNNYFFWLGHGSDTDILGNKKVSSIAAADVAKALQNFSYMTSEAHPKTDQHIYKLVVLDGCETYGPLWAGAFGIPFSSQTSTNIVLEYQYTGRAPRAFVGFSQENKAPNAVDFTGLTHAQFGVCLATLWGDWMSGFPLNYCLQDFSDTAIGYGFTGQDSWKISGCYNLRRGD